MEATGLPHFWTETVSKHLIAINFADNLRRYPWLEYMGRTIIPWIITSVRDKHTNLTRNQLAKIVILPLSF